VKEAILKVYELVMEAYRQKCKSCRKRDDQIHVDFDREKELLFEKGLTSNEVTTNVDRLRQSNSY
jgi:hypothetical protein